MAYNRQFIRVMNAVRRISQCGICLFLQIITILRPTICSAAQIIRRRRGRRAVAHRCGRNCAAENANAYQNGRKAKQTASPFGRFRMYKMVICSSLVSDYSSVSSSFLRKDSLQRNAILVDWVPSITPGVALRPVATQSQKASISVT